MTQPTFFFADIQRRNGLKTSFQVAPVYLVQFFGEKRTDRFRKTQRIRANWTCAQDRFFFVSEKNFFEGDMASQSLVCSHTTHNHTTHHTLTIQQSHRPHRGPTTRSDDLVTSLPPLRRVAFRGNRCRFGTVCAGSG